MNDKIIVGKKTTRKDILKSYLGLSLMGALYGFLGVRLYSYFGSSKIINITIFVALLISNMLFITPLITITQRIEIDQRSLKYYHVKGYLNKFREVFKIFRNDKEEYDFSIRVEEINKVQLTYRKTMVTGIWNLNLDQDLLD